MQQVLPPDEIRVLELSREKVAWMWELSKRSWPAVPESFRLFEGFVRYVTSPDVVILEVSDGVVFVDEITEGVKAKVHPLYGRRGVPRADRIVATRWAAWWIFSNLGVRRIWGETPEVQPLLRTMLRFARDVGFKHEGVLRDGIFFDGKFHNSHVHGMLDEDLEAKEVSDGRWELEVKAEDGERPHPRAAAAESGGLPERSVRGRDEGVEPAAV